MTAYFEHRPTARVLDILELLSASTGLTLTEISIAIKVPKSTLSPIIRTLLNRNFISLNPQNNRYFINFKSFIVGSSYIQNMDILLLVRDEMKKTVKATNETCQFGILINGDVLYIAKEDSPEPIRLMSFEGKKLPAYCTAIGKALLLSYSWSDLCKLYPEKLPAITPMTITDLHDLYNELSNFKETGITTEKEEVSKDLYCFAVPIEINYHTIAALSVSVPKFRVTDSKIDIITNTLINAKSSFEKLFSELHISEKVFINNTLQ